MVITVNPLSFNTTKWPNTLKQFVDCCPRIVWVCLTILCDLYFRKKSIINILQGTLLSALHKKLSFPSGIFAVNVTKFVGNCGFGHTSWTILSGRGRTKLNNFFLNILRISYISDPSFFYLIMVEWKKILKKLMTEIKVMNGISVSCVGSKL